MKKYIYVPGADNTEFWVKLKKLRKADPKPAFRFEGSYDVSTYNYNGEIWEVWDDADSGIPYSIERVF